MSEKSDEPSDSPSTSTDNASVSNSVVEGIKDSPIKEIPPPQPRVLGQPKQQFLQDLLPQFGTLTTEQVADPKVVGIILGILREKLSENAFLRNDLEGLSKQLNDIKEKLIAAQSKLRERWKAWLLLQILSAISALAIGFAFKFQTDKTEFSLFLATGVVILIVVIILSAVVNWNSES